MIGHRHLTTPRAAIRHPLSQALPTFSAQADCDLPVLPSRRTLNEYNASELLLGVSVSAPAGSAVNLTFSVSGPFFGAAQLSAVSAVSVGACLPTESFNADTAVCECAPGFFADPSKRAPGAPEADEPCVKCAPGYVADAPGALACLPCPEDTYSSPTGAECLLCPEGSNAPEAAKALSACACPFGQYAKFTPDRASFTCAPCPTGALCDASVWPLPLAQEGWWHDPAYLGAFYVCKEELCEAETPEKNAYLLAAAAETAVSSNSSTSSSTEGDDQGGGDEEGESRSSCREGHMGPVRPAQVVQMTHFCSVAQQNFARLEISILSTLRSDTRTISFSAVRQTRQVCGVCMEDWALEGEVCVQVCLIKNQ